MLRPDKEKEESGLQHDTIVFSFWENTLLIAGEWVLVNLAYR